MKRRLTIEGDWHQNSHGDWLIYNRLDEVATFRREIVVSVEDVPDPLPTKPGERFWGRSTHFWPQWWFVAGSNSCRPDPNEVDYVGADGTHISSLLAVESHGLTRLPDPELQP